MTGATRRAGVVAGVTVLAAVVLPLFLADRASAHPLGNFTVNRYARIEVSGAVLHVHYVLDLAEVPSLAEAEAIEADPEAYARRRVDGIVDGLRLEVGGRVVPLEPGRHVLTRPRGEAGLPTTRLAVNLTAHVGGEVGTPHDVRLTDGGEPQRLGWREIVVLPRSDARIIAGAPPTADLTDGLRHYPNDRLAQPLDRRVVAFTFVTGGGQAPAPSLGEDLQQNRPNGRLSALVAEPLTGPLAVVTALLVAAGVGAAHALGPGHGKTVMAAYLVGMRGSARDAVVIAGVVSLMHTASVLVLGLVLLQVPRLSQPERVYPWLALTSGLAVASVGLYLCRRRFSALRAGHQHGHGPHHHHHHGPTDSPLSWRGIAALATSGGLFPSPSALVVLLAAVALDRTVYGLALVAAFSIGLAASLAAVGVSLLKGSSTVARARLLRGLPRVLPALSAVALVLVGAGLATQALLDIV